LGQQNEEVGGRVTKPFRTLLGAGKKIKKKKKTAGGEGHWEREGRSE